MRVRNITIENPDLLACCIKKECDPAIKYRLAFLQSVKEDPDHLEDSCQIFSVSVPTAYVWIREWNKNGYEGIAHPYHKSERLPWRPPKLDDTDLLKLKTLLSEKPNWLTKEVVALIFKHWGIQLSCAQVTRILRKKLKMHFSKPYPHDYRRPADAEERLMEEIESKYKSLKNKGFDRKEIAIGFLDEASPQTTSNTVRFWHFGHGDIVKNTTRHKSNTIGFYAVNGNDAIDFLPNSKKESIASFLPKIKQANKDYKSIVLILDNFKSHTSELFRSTAEQLDIVLVFLTPYSPDLNPIEQIWKSVKREVSVSFVQSLEDLRDIIAKAWRKLSQKLSFAQSWIEQFIPWILIET